MREKLIESFRGMVDTVIDSAPAVLTGIVLVVLALILAKVAEVVLRAILVRVRFDKLVERAGVDKALQRIGIRQQLNQFIPRLVYFLLLFLLAKMVSDALGLAAISNALGTFFGYLPNLVAALLLLIIGTTAGQFAGRTVAQAAENAGIEFAPSLGRVVSGLIVFIVMIMAVSQLKIDTEMIRLFTAFLLAGAALAFGLSFGLGTREVTRHIIAGFYARRVLEVGRTLEIAGQSGVVKAITPTHTIIETDERIVTVSNGTFLDQVTKQ